MVSLLSRAILSIFKIKCLNHRQEFIICEITRKLKFAASQVVTKFFLALTILMGFWEADTGLIATRERRRLVRKKIDMASSAFNLTAMTPADSVQISNEKKADRLGKWNSTRPRGLRCSITIRDHLWVLLLPSHQPSCITSQYL